MSLLRCIGLSGLILAITALPCDNVAHAADGKVHAFLVGKLWPGQGDRIDDAVLLVADGKILKAGARSDIQIPESAVRHDLQNSVVVPGFVIAETSLGNASDDDRTLTPEVRAIDGFDLFGDYSDYVAAGITTVQISPGQQRLMPGQSAVVKLAGRETSGRVLSRQESLRLILTQESANVPRIYEPPVGAVSVDNPLDPTRPQVAESLAARIAGLRAVFAAAKDGAVDEDGVVDFDALRDAIKSSRFRIKAGTDAEIRAALNLMEELQTQVDRRFKLTLTDPLEVESVLSDLQKRKSVSVILNAGVRAGQLANPSVPDPDQPQPMKPWDIAKALLDSEASGSVAIRPASDSDLDEILFVASLFRRGGATAAEVLQMLTSNPASILGVADRVGSLQAGRDADFVVLTDDPFTSGTLIQSTWVDGESVYQRDSVDQSTVIEAASVYTSAGNKVDGGKVLVGNGKIQAIGRSVSLPENVMVKRYPQAVVVPGFIDIGTGLGFGGSLSRVTLSTKLGERLAIDDPSIRYARQGGVTTAIYVSSSSPGPMLAFKLGDTPRLLKEPVGIRFNMPSNLTSGVPSLKKTLATAKAYAASWKKYESELAAYNTRLASYKVALAKYEAAKKAAEAKAAAEKKKAEEEAAKKKPEGEKEAKKTPDDSAAKDDASGKKTTAETDKKDEDQKEGASEKSAELKAPEKPTEPKKPKASSTYEAYRPLFAGSIPAVVQAGNVKAITAAVKLFREEFQLPMILVGANDAHRVSDLLAKNKVRVSVGPTMVREVDNQTINLAQVMSNHQIPIAFQSNATTGVQQLPLAVQYAVYKGLSATDALDGLTKSPASMFSLDETVGSLQPGKDADLVILSGPPFDPSSQVIAVMIDGNWVYERGAE